MASLLFWALAMYGALTLVWQVTRRLQHRVQPQLHPLTIVLIVQNAETQIEGILRSLMVGTAFGQREHHILVFDVDSADDTGAIVQRMTKDYQRLAYHWIQTEQDFVEHLRHAAMNGAHVGCIYDLRINGMSSELARDIRLLCQ